MPFPTIDNAALLQRRNSYAYPAVTIDAGAQTWVELNFTSMFALDTCLNQRLNSANADEVILRYLGALFWGHASGANGRNIRPRAHGKVRLAYAGQNRIVNGQTQRMRGILDVGKTVVVGHIRSAISHIRNDRYADAISELNELPQLKVAFSSKLCSFIAPDKCGVIDSQIAERFPEIGFLLRGGYVVDNTKNRMKYGDYCLWLQTRSSSLNSDPCHAYWTDRDGTQRAWRAVDVERGLYA
jgi:hypothetical protein